MNNISTYLKKIFIISELKYRFFLFLFLTILASFIDIVNLALIIPIVGVVLGDKTQNNFNLPILDSVEILFNGEQIILLFVIFFLLKSFFAIYIYKKIVEVKVNLQAKLRIDLLKKYQHITHSDFISKETSYYIHNITNLVTIYSNGLLGLLRLITESLIVITIMLYFIIIFGLKIIPFLLISFFIVLIYQLLFKNKILNIAKKINIDSKSLIQTIKDMVMGIKEIKIAKKQKYFERLVSQKAKNLAKNNLISEIITFSPRYLIESFFVIFFFGFIFFNLNTLKNTDINIIYIISTFLYAAFRIIPSLSVVSRSLTIMNNSVIATNILFEDLYQNKNILSNFNLNKSVNWSFKQIKFNNVSFGYSNKNIFLNKLNFEINRGDKVLLLGNSGSGKSTIADLSLGFYMPTHGDILINGNINNYDNIRNNSYYLSQNKLLFNETIFKNIILDKNINSYIDLDDNQKILYKRAITISNIEEMITSKPEREEYLIGDSGNHLSGGQKQRICVARMIFEDREFNIMDESTSEIHSELEFEIYNNLIKDLNNEKTYIVISHNKDLKNIFNKKILIT